MSTRPKTQTPRYERKFILNQDQALGLSRLIKTHPAHFAKAYPDRQVNNIYYDTTDFAHFRENLAGVSPRKKLRIRWYGNFNSTGPLRLEIKAKTGEIVSKTSLLLKDDLRHSTTLPAKFADFYLEQAGIYHPVLKNAYMRQYYLTASKQVRLTVDTDLRFSRFTTSPAAAPKQSINRTIVELKYPLTAEEEALNLSRYFPFRLSKSSKYLMGTSLCHPHLQII